MKSTAEVVRVGNAFAWIEEQKAIQIKAADPNGDAVTLTAEQARRFAEMVARLADSLESLEQQE